MRFVVKALALLALLGGLAVAGYAYFGDMDPRPVESRVPVTLDGAR